MDKKPAGHDAEILEVNLRDPLVAGVLAWLWPGAGHIYQGRYGKGLLFMICILGAYFFGLAIGDGRVVYASWRQPDFRWQYVCQLGVGLPSLPALVQHQRMKSGKPPLWVIGYRDPRTLELIDGPPEPGELYIADGLMAPPASFQAAINADQTVLSKWHEELAIRFEMGTLYTVIAGLLNVLAIWDACAGPMLPKSEEEEEAKGAKNSREKPEDRERSGD